MGRHPAAPYCSVRSPDWIKLAARINLHDPPAENAVH
jgi:hypothetical protein